MMKYNFFAILAGLMLTCTVSLWADDVITIRLSYKVVLNPADGTRPPGVRDADIDRAIATMNTLEQTYYRGYRFQRVDPVIDIGGQGDLTGPSRWYDTDFFEDGDAKDIMEREALNSPALYSWNANAINLYITNLNNRCGGVCALPSNNDNLIIIAGCSDRDALTQLHEIGHYFNLFHTQGDICGCCESGESGECHTEPGDDFVDDTLPDLACWDRDGIANWTYQTDYANLNSAQQELVNDVFLNVMSYHGSACGQNAVTTRMTEGQLDRWTDTANDERRGVANGRTWFVGTPTSGFGNGTSANPFLVVSSALSVANPQGGDIILLRPGAHRTTLLSNRLVLDKPLTLRATRAGAAIIDTTNLVAQSSPSQSPEKIIMNMDEDVAVISSGQSSIILGFAGSKATRKD